MTENRQTYFDRMLEWLGTHLSGKLRNQVSGYRPFTPSDFKSLFHTLRQGDILLVEGNQRISNAIKYLTQSTWSHAAFYVGDALPAPSDNAERPRLIEVNVGEGCIAVPLSKYQTYNTRICRPVGLSKADHAAVVAFMVDKIGLQYDMRNIFDLLRYFFPTPPVPVHWRRRMIAFGSGDPTRAICSSLIAEAYQSVGYPILPTIFVEGATGDFARHEVYHIRHHSLFAPRDFDLSPYFEVIKPTLAQGFDYHTFDWAPDVSAAEPLIPEPDGL